MNVNPLQPQVVQADTQDDLIYDQALAKLKTLFNTKRHYGIPDKINDFGINADAMYGIMTDSGDNSGQLLDPSAKGSLVGINGKYTINGMGKHVKNFDLSIQLSDDEVEAIKKHGLKYSFKLLVNQGSTSVFQYPGSPTSNYSNAYGDLNYGQSGSVQLVYDFEDNNGPVSQLDNSSIELTLDPDIDLILPNSEDGKPKQIEAGKKFSDYKLSGDLKTGSNINVKKELGISFKLKDDSYDYSLLTDKAIYNTNVKDVILSLNSINEYDPSNKKDIPTTGDTFESGKTYRQKVTINLYGLTSGRGQFEPMMDNFKINGQVYHDKSSYTYSYYRYFMVPAPQRAMTINISPDNSKPNMGDSISDITTIASIGLAQAIDSKPLDMSNVDDKITDPDGTSVSEKDTFNKEGKYTQTISINLEKLYGQDWESAYDSKKLIINGPGKINQSTSSYVYNRVFDIKKPTPPAKNTVVLNFGVTNIENIPYGTPVSQYNKLDSLQSDPGNHYKVNDINTTSIISDDSRPMNNQDILIGGDYTQSYNIDLKKLLGPVYNQFQSGALILKINGKQIDESKTTYTISRKLSTSYPKFDDPIELDNYSIEPDVEKAKRDINSKMEDQITLSNVASSISNQIDYQNGEIVTDADKKPISSGTLKSGNYDWAVKINLKGMFGDKYNDITDKIKINGNSLVKDNIDKDGIYTYYKQFTVSSSNSGQNPAPTPPPAPTPSPNPVPQPAPSQPSEQPVNTNQETDIAGIVRVVSDYAHVYNSQGQLVNDRILSLNSAWKTDRKRILNVNGEIYYRVSTDEYVKNSQVVFDYDYQYDSLQKSTTITTLNTPRVVRVVIPNYISLWSKSDDNQHMSKIGDRNLAYNSEWKIDQIAVVDGVTFYRVSSNEWVKAVQVILVDVNGLLTGDLKVSNLPSSLNIKVTAPGYINLWSKLSDNLHLEELVGQSVPTNSIFKTDQTAVIDGITFYRISTNEWIQDNCVTIIN